MSEDFFDLLSDGESQTLEIKEVVRDPQVLARLICAFANADGGKILIGVREHETEIVGVEETLIRKVYDKAIQKLTPKVEARIRFLDARIVFKVAIIEVGASPEIVLADGGAYVRTGRMTQPMAWSQILSRLPNEPSHKHIELLTQSIESQTKIIESLHVKIDEANSWQAKWKGYLTSGAVGFIFSMVLALMAG
ncbi:ATP-binding protein [Vreelandella titanicae]|uniref:AlbA family DNA-binding domain-containing protein n=1 Tax=Vreelandella titanicae TaxID=664683 RepID=UPI00241F798B|nr:ATP-binding protein [Halomonas titanicae]